MENYFKNKNKESCCGCRNCYNVCPKNAILMTSDEKGFLYPEINEELCIKCGLCERICRFSKAIPQNAEKLESYAAVHNEKETLLKSSSGGAFTALSDLILKKDGIVYGALLDSNLKLVFQRATSSLERDNLRGTKYFQADMKKVCCDIQGDLDAGRYVLFCGTPCQCDAIKEYTKRQEKLLLVDFICHGVPSPLVFDNYLDYLEKLCKSPVKTISFRNKKYGYQHSQFTTAEFENGGRYMMMPSVDVFYRSFLSNVMLRESCYKCPYTCTGRVSDVTIADGWGSVGEKIESELGVSTLIVNTEKSRNILSELKSDLILKEIDLDGCLQPQLKHPSKKPEMMEEWWKVYHHRGIELAGMMLMNRKQRYIKLVMERIVQVGNATGKQDLINKVLQKIWK